ncbi:MAG: gamma-glutamyl-gamma-aminobutyrate hydrolase family protein [Gemmatimonadales bacterium]|jgi:putative glutamine amidotransferase
MSRPRIGITGLTRTVDGLARTGANAAYVAAVVAGGGLPLLLSPLLPPEMAEDLTAGLDGLVFSGGADIDPARYHAHPHSALGPVEPDRDAFEFALVAAARARRLPVLAICRGFQLVNVALGGTLWQDLPSERPGPVAHSGNWARTARVHPVELLPKSRTAEVLAVTRLTVNSFHHQGVRDLAPGLVASGTAPDALVEAFEGNGGPWLLGVQWHPEAFHAEAGAPDQRLFAALARAAEA